MATTIAFSQAMMVPEMQSIISQGLMVKMGSLEESSREEFWLLAWIQGTGLLVSFKAMLSFISAAARYATWKEKKEEERKEEKGC